GQQIGAIPAPAAPGAKAFQAQVPRRQNRRRALGPMPFPLARGLTQPPEATAANARQGRALPRYLEASARAAVMVCLAFATLPLARTPMHPAPASERRRRTHANWTDAHC